MSGEPDRPDERVDPETDEAPDTPTAQVGVDYRAVARVASRSQLLGVRLRQCHADCFVRAEDVAADWAATTFTGYRADVVEDSGEGSGFRTEVSFIALYKRDLDLMNEGLDVLGDEAPDLAIEVVFELAYDLPESADLQPGDLEQFALANSVLHAWPYWRELAQSMSTRMGVPPLVVGTYKMPYAHDPEE